VTLENLILETHLCSVFVSHSRNRQPLMSKACLVRVE
jgi:hypothetical protein